MRGPGGSCSAVLLAEFWQLGGGRDYLAWRSLSGVAPVPRRSGKTSVVVRRYACNNRLANALYHWARLATQHDALIRRHYAALRQRGHSHGPALHPVADRLLRWPGPSSNIKPCSTPPPKLPSPPALQLP